jgi:hypothetical protein
MLEKLCYQPWDSYSPYIFVACAGHVTSCVLVFSIVYLNICKYFGLSFTFRPLLPPWDLCTVCPTRYRTWHFFNRLAGWLADRCSVSQQLGALQTHSSSFLTQWTYSCSNFVAKRNAGFSSEWDILYISLLVRTTLHLPSSCNCIRCWSGKQF